MEALYPSVTTMLCVGWRTAEPFSMYSILLLFAAKCLYLYLYQTFQAVMWRNRYFATLSISYHHHHHHHHQL